jgi:hypothetical protein
MRVLIFFILAMPLAAATVVTIKERLHGTIVAESDSDVILRSGNGAEVRILRSNILQVFDDQGTLVWQAAVLPEEERPEVPHRPAPLAGAKKSVLLDFYMGGVTGGIYADEKQFVRDLRIYSQYSDGSPQFAESAMMSYAGGASYQVFDSARWATLVSYLYRSTSHAVYIGDGTRYEKISLADQVLTRRHAGFYGKEMHFYPGLDLTSFFLIGQIGYELGSYRPLSTYGEYRQNLNPVPAAYMGSSSLLTHGPAARGGGGISLRGEHWQFRLLGFYQLSAMFMAKTTAITAGTVTLAHDFYGGVSVGYGW